MEISKLREIYDELSKDLSFCGDVEYLLIVQMRAATARYIEGIEHAQNIVPRKGYSGGGKDDVC